MIFQYKRGASIVGFFLVIVSTVFVGDYIKNLHRKVNSLKSYNEMKDDSISYYRNEQNELVAERNAAIVRAKDLKEMRQSLLAQMATEFKGVDRKLKNLASATTATGSFAQKITTQIKDSVIVHEYSETKFDTLVVKAINWQDDWTTIKGFALQDCVRLDLSVDVPLNIVTYYPRWKLLGKERKWLPLIRKKMKIEAKSPNPNVKITKIEHLTTK